MLQIKATKPQSSTLPKNGTSSSMPRRITKKLKSDSTAPHDYDPLYVDSSGEEDQMEDIQPSSSLNRPADATAVVAPPLDSVLTRCFNELLKARNEVSWTTMCLDSPSISIRSPS